MYDIVLDLGHIFEVDQIPVIAFDKVVILEHFFCALQSTALGELSLCRVIVEKTVLDLYIINVIGIEFFHASLGADGKFQIIALAMHTADRPFQSKGKTIVVDGF